MRPPAWALRRGQLLDPDGFTAEFSRAWSGLTSRFLKLECWQSYREIEANQSQVAYEHGDIEKAQDLLAREAELDRPLYADTARKHIDYTRIRLVQEPLSPYLRYELMSYRIRCRMGENIAVVKLPGEVKLPNDDYFDFLLFDRHVALIHDYGETGSQSGGWITYNIEVIDALERTALGLRKIATPVEQYTQQ
jgi:uncharacterized protein DUF6879